MRMQNEMRREDVISFIVAHKARFEKEFGVKRIGLFGSYARGEVREESDIDIVVEIEKPDLFHLIGIKQAIEEALGAKDDIGLEKLDSICMQLINTGEALKEIDKLTEGNLLAHYPDIDWKKAKGLRDIITHHYFDIDTETVFVVCKERIPEMQKVIQ